MSRNLANRTIETLDVQRLLKAADVVRKQQLGNLIGTTEAAKIHGCSRQYIYHLVRRGVLDYYPMTPGVFLVDREQILKLPQTKRKSQLNSNNDSVAA